MWINRNRWKRREHSIDLNLGDGLIRGTVKEDLVKRNTYNAYANNVQLFTKDGTTEEEAMKLVEDHIISKLEIVLKQTSDKINSTK